MRIKIILSFLNVSQKMYNSHTLTIIFDLMLHLDGFDRLV